MIHYPSPPKINSSYQEQERFQFKGQSIDVNKMIDARFDRNFRAAIIEMFQQAIMNMLRTNEERIYKDEPKEIFESKNKKFSGWAQQKTIGNRKQSANLKLEQ